MNSNSELMSGQIVRCLVKRKSKTSYSSFISIHSFNRATNRLWVPHSSSGCSRSSFRGPQPQQRQLQFQLQLSVFVLVSQSQSVPQRRFPSLNTLTNIIRFYLFLIRLPELIIINWRMLANWGQLDSKKVTDTFRYLGMCFPLSLYACVCVCISIFLHFVVFVCLILNDA